MNAKLILLTLLINIIFIFIYKTILDKFYRNKFQQIKNYLSSLLGLNISHLHDAANFFALIKNQSQDHNLQNFAKGASFHFRSLFEELNQSKKIFDEIDSSQIQDNHLALLYNKEAIDLKDILQLELLQLSSSSDNRLEIIDKSNAEHALSYGNFSLLSKAILNLVENALKYTEKPIKLELNDTGNSWQIKVSSYGKSIPESLANAINNQVEDSPSSGHGLNSLNQIMLFHNAELVIDTLADEGTCIRLIFKKYQGEAISPTSLKVTNKKPFPIKREILIPIILGIILLSSIYTIYHNKTICQAYYKSFTKVDDPNIIQKERQCLQYLEYLNEVLVDDIPDELYLNYTANDKEELLEQIYYDFIKHFSDKDKDLIALILFDQILITAPMDYQPLIDKEAKSLILKFPSAANLNFYLSNHYFEKRKYGKATLYSLKSIVALIESKFCMHPQLYLVSKLDRDHDKLSQFLATLYHPNALIEQDLEPESNFNSNNKEDEQIVPKSNPEITTAEPDSKPVANDEIDELIDEQDRKLGLDLDL